MVGRDADSLGFCSLRIRMSDSLVLVTEDFLRVVERCTFPCGDEGEGGRGAASTSESSLKIGWTCLLREVLLVGIILGPEDLRR